MSNDNGYPAPNKVEIRHNRITGNSQAGIVVDNDGSKDAAIYGNVVYKNAGPGLLTWSTLSGTVALRVYNNSFHHNSGHEIDLQNPGATFSPLELKNNIFDAAAGLCLRDTGKDITTHGNNIYHDSNGGTLVTSGGSTYSISTIAADYEATSIVASPGYTDATGGVFSLATSSPAIDAGENLGAAYDDGLAGASAWPGGVVTLDRDLCGSGWDIGAYEHETLPQPADGGSDSGPDASAADGAVPKDSGGDAGGDQTVPKDSGGDASATHKDGDDSVKGEPGRTLVGDGCSCLVGGGRGGRWNGEGLLAVLLLVLALRRVKGFEDRQLRAG